jgi:hypothetical protein
MDLNLPRFSPDETPSPADPPRGDVVGKPPRPRFSVKWGLVWATMLIALATLIAPVVSSFVNQQTSLAASTGKVSMGIGNTGNQINTGNSATLVQVSGTNPTVNLSVKNEGIPWRGGPSPELAKQLGVTESALRNFF